MYRQLLSQLCHYFTLISLGLSCHGYVKVEVTDGVSPVNHLSSLT